MNLADTVALDNKICASHVNYALFDSPKLGFNFFDASGKIPAGTLSGHLISLGHYEQCLNISEISPYGEIKGKYCIVKFVQMMTSFAGYGVCIPESCDYNLGLEQEVLCHTKDSNSGLDNADYWFLTILGLIGFIIILSTLYDLNTRKYELKQKPLYLIFSLLTNGEKLFETRIGKDQISCLAGMRVLSMFWIIFAHKYFILFYAPLRNGLDAFELLYSHWSFYIQAAYMCVDTFFFIGGFVLSYQCFKYRDQISLTWKTLPYFYLHRILRLLPLMALIFFIQITILRRIGDGPLYSVVVNIMNEACLKQWKSYFLFTQNYQLEKTTDLCLGHTWYINVDLQLYLFAPLIIIPATKLLQRNKICKCYCLFFALLLLSILGSMFSIMIFGYEYMHAHTRISPYIIGLMMGLFVLENKDKKFQINTKICIVTWVIAFLMMFVCGYYIVNVAWMKLEVEKDSFSNNFFISFITPLWSLSLCWIIFCCCTKNADILNNFLSNKFFLVVSRLCYSMYLVQFFVIIQSTITTHTPIYMNFFTMVHGSISDIVITTVLSFIFVLAFESPIIALVKFVLSKRRPQLLKNY